tara:strand:+ start:12466 stop:12948 length:483 start_codon:yes stop_codon:yes gene_type:complete
MVNKVMLGGIIDSEIKRAKAKTGTDIVSFRLKTTSTRKYDANHHGNQSGNPQYQQYNQWHNVTAFGGQYSDLSQGEWAFVEGSLNTRSYHCPNTNSKKYTTGVNAQGIYKWGDDKTKCVIGGCEKNDEVNSTGTNSSVGNIPESKKNTSSSDESFDDIPF